MDALRVAFDGGVEALRGVSLTLNQGESLAVIGETGSGKSTLALCLAGLIQPPNARGSVRVKGDELIGAAAELLRSVRWEVVALGLQGAPFNPVVSLGDQVAEPLRERRGMKKVQARSKAEELAAEVALDPAVLARYPHEVSGGERRRASLAMALALDPEVLVLDEPTAGVDSATKEEMVGRIVQLQKERGFALIVVSHELTDASALAQRTMVLYAGEAMETGPADEVVGRPAHPYTWALFNAYPVMTTTKDLRPIAGLPPDPRAVPPGCPFHPRCTQVEEICLEQHPGLVDAAPSNSGSANSGDRRVACHFGGLKILLEAQGLSKSYRSGHSEVRALQGVGLELREGESLGVVGPSGSGKSTLARILSGQLEPDAGRVILEGRETPVPRKRWDRDTRRRIQLVMQDPWEALSPRMPVEALVGEPLDILKQHGGPERRKMVGEILESVGLPSEGGFLRAFAHELSGGQLQRVCLARALITRPKLLVADEPTSMLDASEQARLLTVLRERQIEMGLGLILISHDMAVVRKVTDRIVVLDAGFVVEEGPSNVVSTQPSSDTARRLVASAPGWTPARSA